MPKTTPTSSQINATAVLLGTCLFLSPGGVKAGEKEEALIDKVVAAYGGDKLVNLKGLRLTDKHKSFRSGQSEMPGVVDMSPSHSSVTVDLVNKRKDFQLVRGAKADFSTRHRVFDGKTGYQMNHTARTLRQDNNITYANVDWNYIHYLDTAMVLALNDTRKTASYEGEQHYKGAVHDLIKFDAEDWPEMTLFVHRETGRIGKMKRASWGDGFFNTQFSGFEQKQGIGYASNIYVTESGQPYLVSVARQLELNPDMSANFKVPANYGAEGKTLDFSKMSARKLADNLYMAGYDWGFSIFYDAGDYFIGAGGYEELSDRFAAMKKLAGVDKPLKYQVVSHHHDDHLGGMKEAAEMGVTFIAAKDHIATIRSMAKVDLPDSRFIIVDGAGTYAGGALKVIDLPNGHANHNLMSYFPSANTLFTADMYFSRQATGAPNGHGGLIEIRDKVKAAGLKVEHYAAAHSGRVMTAADLDKSIGQVVKPVCPADWDGCKDL